MDTGTARLRRWGTEEGLRSAKFRFKASDVLYGKLRPYLDKAALAEWAGICSTDIIVLEPRPEEADPGFLSFLLHSPAFVEHAMSTTGGVNLPRTSWSSLATFSQIVPELPEQRAITGVLRTIQSAVEVQNRIVAKLKELKSATMAKLFREGLRGEPLKQTEIGEIPESWEVVRLRNVAEVRGSTISFSEIERHRRKDTGLRVLAIKVSDMNRSGNETHIHDAAIELLAPPEFATRYAIPKDSIVFPKRGAAIATNKKRLTTTPTVLDPNLIAVVPRATLDPRFLFAWFQTFDITSLQTPGAIPQLNKKDLDPLQVPRPSDLDEQLEIGRLLGVVDQRIATASSHLAALKDVFASALRVLMTGQVRLRVS